MYHQQINLLAGSPGSPTRDFNEKGGNETSKTVA